MPSATRPAGPGLPKREQLDATRAREEIDEMIEDRSGAAAGADPTRGARQAARDAHGDGSSAKSSIGGDKNKGRA